MGDNNLFPSVVIFNLLAGLLTYSIFDAFPFLDRTVAKRMSKIN